MTHPVSFSKKLLLRFFRQCPCPCDVGEQIGNGVDRIRYEGLAMTKYSCNEFE